jgi:glycosyltransferase involved in cell wall biosynthesis
MNQEFPLVSVIMSCYNQAQFVVEALNSIKNQIYPNLQLIIWDDYSKDNSVAVIEKWIIDNDYECIFLKHTENIGICKSLNNALTYVNGKYLQLTAADDILLKDKVSRHVQILENSKDTDALVFSDAFLINSKGELYQNRFIAYYKKYLSLYSGNYYLSLLKDNYIPGMTLLCKTQIIRDLNGFDENICYEDHDLLLRISKTFDFIFDDEVSVKYRLHESNFHKNINWDIPHLYIYMKHLDQEYAKTKCLQILKKMYVKKNPELKLYTSLYFQKEKAAGFRQFCIKHNLPVWMFQCIDIPKRLILRIKANNY